MVECRATSDAFVGPHSASWLSDHGRAFYFAPRRSPMRSHVGSHVAVHVAVAVAVAPGYPPLLSVSSVCCSSTRALYARELHIHRTPPFLDNKVKFMTSLMAHTYNYISRSRVSRFCFPPVASCLLRVVVVTTQHMLSLERRRRPDLRHPLLLRNPNAQ